MKKVTMKEFGWTYDGDQSHEGNVDGIEYLIDRQNISRMAWEAKSTKYFLGIDNEFSSCLEFDTLADAKRAARDAAQRRRDERVASAI